MTENELQQLLDEYHVPSHIRAHMNMVSKIAVFLGKKIVAAGEEIDIANLERAAKIHDFVKLCDFKELKPEYLTPSDTKEDISFWEKLIEKYHHLGHVQAAYEILKQRGEDTIATIIKKHRYNCIIDQNKNERPVTWEEKILYYADKRVRHDRIVGIKERVEDGRRRYYPDGDVPPNDDRIYRAILLLEKELCRKANINPEDITEESV